MVYALDVILRRLTSSLLIRYFILITFIILTTDAIATPRVYSWGTTKDHLRNSVQLSLLPKTLYAGCNITKDYRVDLISCNFKYVLSKTVYDSTGLGYIDAEHMVPASRLMQHANCGLYSRTYCRKVNPEFKRCHNSLVNLYPAISTINRFRGNLPYGEISDVEAWYPFGTDIGFKKNLLGTIVEPPNRAKKRIAKAYLLMNEYNCINLTANESIMYARWYTNY